MYLRLIALPNGLNKRLRCNHVNRAFETFLHALVTRRRVGDAQHDALLVAIGEEAPETAHQIRPGRPRAAAGPVGRQIGRTPSK